MLYEISLSQFKVQYCHVTLLKFKQSSYRTGMMTAMMNGHHQHYDNKQYFFPCFLYILLTFFYNLTRLHVQNGNDDYDDDCDNEWYLFSSVFIYST